MKQIKQIDFLKLGEKMLVIVGMLLTINLSLVGFASAAELPKPPCNKLTGVNCTASEGSVNDLIVTVINVLLGVAFLIAVFFLVIGGFRYIMSAGNEEQAEKGKKTIVNALIGIVIIILSYVIVQVVSRFAGNAGSGTV